MNFFQAFSNDIGIDLGTSSTLVYLRGKGIVINEPSAVALNKKTGRVVAVGNEAKEMMGRTPGHIRAVAPLVDGVISDFEVAEEMMSYLLRKVQDRSRKLFGPRVVVGVPSGVTNVERRAVRDATKSAGAREVHVVEEPMAAAIGARLPIGEALGSMIIDIGGGTTDIAVMSLNGVVLSRNLKVAGNHLDMDIISFVRNEFKVLIGKKTAEDIKISLCSVVNEEELLEKVVRGRDIITGLPREIVVNDSHIKQAISRSIDILIDNVKEVLETTPPEITSDIMRSGIYLAGGGALVKGLDYVLSEWLAVPVYVIDDPLTVVARGTGLILENLPFYRDILIQNEEELFSKN